MAAPDSAGSARQISLLDIYNAVAPRPVIAINQRKAARHCPVSCQMKGIMSSVADGAEEAVRRHLRGISLQRAEAQDRRLSSTARCRSRFPAPAATPAPAVPARICHLDRLQFLDLHPERRRPQIPEFSRRNKDAALDIAGRIVERLHRAIQTLAQPSEVNREIGEAFVELARRAD